MKSILARVALGAFVLIAWLFVAGIVTGLVERHGFLGGGMAAALLIAQQARIGWARPC